MDNSEKILTLIKPFVEQGKILPRSQQEIEQSIDDFILIFDQDRLIACAGLKNCQEDAMGEIYSLAVAADQQNTGLSTELLKQVLIKAKSAGFSKIFALTKFGTHWFLKNDFMQMTLSDLPSQRQKHFDHSRNSSIFFKAVD